MFIVLFYMINIVKSQSNDDILYNSDIYHLRRHTDSLGSYKAFKETSSIKMIDIKDCYPVEIKYLINNITLLYNKYDSNSETEALFLSKMCKDIQQNYRIFCNIITDSMNGYVKTMTFIINRLIEKQKIDKGVAISLKKSYLDFSIKSKCDDIIKNIKEPIEEYFGSVDSKGILCIRRIERQALFHGLRHKSLKEQ